MANILITTRSVASCATAVSMLQQAGHSIRVQIGVGDMPEEVMAGLVAGVDALIVGVDRVTRRVVEAGAPTLKIIARNGVGYNNVDLDAAAEHGVAVTVAPGASAVSVAELALGLMLTLSRSIACQNQCIQSGGWERPMGTELYGRTLGILGVGTIGSEVARRARALGMSVLACDILPNHTFAAQVGFPYVPLEELLQGSDILTLHVPATPETRGIIGRAALARMRPGALLINTARGELVDEHAVRGAILSGVLGGYAADTLLREPPLPGDPLLGLDRVVLTPHCGAYTRQAVERCGIMVAEEVLRVLCGEAPHHPVVRH